MGVRKGAGGGPLLAIVAHLDTVFPEGTDVKVKRDGTRLMAPGIGDDSRGLAVMLAVIRAMNSAKLQTASDILFVGNVGEEGEGDLRGVKYLMLKGKYKDRIKQFLALDGGAQSAITRAGVGSKRYRVVFKGPGGHSYGAFGLVNPAYAMAAAIARFADVQVPSTPKTTYNVGAVKGGTSVNSIPFEVSMDVDIRSESCEEMHKVDATFVKIVKSAVDEENRVRSTREGRIEADLRVIGERPCGETPMQSAILRSTAAMIRAFGLTPTYNSSSTDSNIPMSLGIPALTIGRGAGRPSACTRRVDRRRAESHGTVDRSRARDRSDRGGIMKRITSVQAVQRFSGSGCGFRVQGFRSSAFTGSSHDRLNRHREPLNPTFEPEP